MYNYKGRLECYFVEYFGDLKEEMKKVNYGFVYEEIAMYYVVLLEKGKLENFINDFPDTISIEQNYIYELSHIEKSNYDGHYQGLNFKPKYLDSEVTIAVVGDGIDYLDKEFWREDGGSKIKAIWDQTVDIDKSYNEPYGHIYTKNQIDEALDLFLKGHNPYERVKHWSEGQCTNLCKIIGGNKFGLVNNCNFIMVKLLRASKETKIMNCINDKGVNLYETYDIVKSLQCLLDLNQLNKNPMVVYLPFESNSGGRNGTSVLERYIDYCTNRSNNLFIITTSGGEGEGYTHNGGKFQRDEELNIPIIVGNEENYKDHEEKSSFQISLWTNIYDEIDFKIISPSLEETINLDSSTCFQIMNFTLSDGEIEIIFTKPRLRSMEKEIIIKIRNAVQGKWIINSKGRNILYGDYDIWLPIKRITNHNITFQDTHLYKTNTNPSTASKILTSICHSQNEMTIGALSGKLCEIDNKSKGGAFIIDSGEIVIEDDYGKLKITGIALSGCELCCMVTMILQWSLIKRNKQHVGFNEVKFILEKASSIESSNNYNIINMKKLNHILMEP